MIESGVVLLKSNKELQDSITLETENIIKARINNDSTYQFYVRKLNVKEGDIWYGRGYLIYEDANGEIKTVYSDIRARGVIE
ncbi:hypothetical protein RBH29_04230 [Herbivorax sp. ANBcel31]|uniref:hypothetical protein n=1 Tax=Herbivorax sp. ANBcel31 TaxID=3069754 RepID=UPI0027B396CA|nr:hypothetical protein [Herbivorax sp. ANBcel31]MDQ2085641.1 hypothetical protein [Herbivorax sp. ANBcel31]